jgi:hypothetical protein
MPNSSARHRSQFSMQSLLAGVTVLGLLFAIIRQAGPWGVLLALLVLALVSAHVVGNALGTKLRDEVSRELNPDYRRRQLHLRPASGEHASRRLHEHTPLGRMIVFISVGGAVVGGILGGLALAVWTRATVPGWIVGTISSAVLGAFFGFLMGSFLDMSIRAWWQASHRE